MSKILGIDYGAKRIGVAMSDENGKIAFPFLILPNDKDSMSLLGDLCGKEKIERIVMGESLDERENENEIMPEARLFVEALSGKTGLPVSFEKEFMTSVEAHRSAFKEQGKIGRQEVDASAAALILQRYLDKINSK